MKKIDDWDRFLAHERASKDTIDLKRIYIKIAGGILPGVFLSQLIFWFLPNRENKPKLAKKDTLVKQDKEWVNEICMTIDQVKKARKKLEEKKIITVDIKRSNFYGGNRAVHYKISKEEFLKQYNDWAKKLYSDDEEIEAYNEQITPEDLKEMRKQMDKDINNF